MQEIINLIAVILIESTKIMYEFRLLMLHKSASMIIICLQFSSPHTTTNALKNEQVNLYESRLKVNTCHDRFITSVQSLQTFKNTFYIVHKS